MTNNDETVVGKTNPVKRPANPNVKANPNLEKTVASTVVSNPKTETTVSAKTVVSKPVKTSATVVASRPSAPKASVTQQSSATVVKKTVRDNKKIGNYIREKKLAQGGMGAVYIAKHAELDKKVILKKLILKDNKAAEDRFKREAEILQELQCPYIVNTYEYFKIGKSSYLVEELIEGCSLDKLIEKYKNLRETILREDNSSSWKNDGPLGTELALLIFLDACCGLKFAHDRGIVHRDIKPGNLLISKQAMVKLTDFGIAASDKSSDADDDDDSDDLPVESNGLTVAGSMLGTPSYMSPEQVYDSKNVDQRADIYSMGVMLYEMLTGEKPFDCPIDFSTLTANENVMKSIKKGKYINPRKLNPSIPISICFMIKKMLKYEKTARYETIDPVIKILRKYLSKFDKHDIRVELARAVKSVEDGKNHRIQKFLPKKPIVQIILASVIGVAMFIGLCNWFWTSGNVHKTILSHWFRPINMTLQIPDRGQDNGFSANLPMVAYIFEDGGKQDMVGKSYHEFSIMTDSEKTPEQKKSKAKYFKSKTTYLTKGNYRVKVVLGSYVLWKSISVEDKPVNVFFNDLVKEKREINVITNAFSLKDGSKLKDAKFTVMNSKGNYVSFKEITQKERSSMSVWKVRATCEHYSTKEFSMVVDWYQDTIIVNVGME